MQEKSIFLAKNQQVKREEMREKWGLTEKEEIIAWNYEENRVGSGCFFETPVCIKTGKVAISIFKSFLE